MSLFTPEVEAPPRGGADRFARRSAYGRMGRWIGRAALVVLRSGVGMALCAHYLGALVVAGWTFRLMRQRILIGLWRNRPREGDATFEEFARRRWPDAPLGSTPRLLIAEHYRETIARPTRKGRAPGLLRKGFRAVVGLVGSLGQNVAWGLAATLCTFAVTGPGLLMMLAAWEYGWVVSFDKVYELALIGTTIGFVGMLLFALAMMHVPLAWANLAASGDFRAFFRRGLVARLARERRAAMALYALVFALVTLPATAMWTFRAFVTNVDPTLETASPERVAAFAEQYAQACGPYLFLAFVGLHLLIARIYRRSAVALVGRDPESVREFPVGVASALEELGYVPAETPGRRRLLARVVFGTAGWWARKALVTATFLLWAAVAFQPLLDQFFVYHEFLNWLNPPLVHLPSLHLAPRP